MSLRSQLLINVHAAMANAAKRGKAMRVKDFDPLLPPGRLIAGVVWELRRHGAKIAAVKEGRTVVGYMLKKEIPALAAPVVARREPRADEPTPMPYIKNKPGIFGKTAIKSLPYNPQRRAAQSSSPSAGGKRAA